MDRPTIAQIEAHLAGCLTEAEAGRRIGVSRQAMNQKSAVVKRQMGGIKTPAGWLYDPEFLETYQPVFGRPRTREQASPGLL